jgi:hypothetical protein
MEQKKCQSKKFPERACSQIKDIDQFHSKGNGGTASLCKDCENARARQWKKDHKVEVAAYNKIYKADHKEEVAVYNKQYKTDNREAVNIQKAKHEREKRAENPSLKLRQYISNQIGAALKSNGGSKEGQSAMKYLPYTIQELREHLESQFEDWMNWDNYGEYRAKEWDDNDNSTWIWNVDHIIPKSILPHKTMKSKNFKRCWALSNLRPYSAKQNILDGVNRTRHKIDQ